MGFMGLQTIGLDQLRGLEKKFSDFCQFLYCSGVRGGGLTAPVVLNGGQRCLQCFQAALIWHVVLAPISWKAVAVLWLVCLISVQVSRTGRT